MRLPRRLAAWLQSQEAEQLDPLFRFTPMVATMATVAAIILFVTLRGEASPVVATLWVVTFTAVSLARIVGARRYLRLRPPRERLPVWALWAFGSTLLHVLLLGSVSLIWMHPTRSEAESLMHIVLASVSIGAAVHLPAFYPAFFVYVIGLMAPLALRDLWIGGGYHLTLALLVIATALYTLQAGWRQAQAHAQTRAERLKNAALIEALRLQNERTDAARRLAEQAHAAKARFFAAANHDLRQPLHAMGLLAHSLRAPGGLRHAGDVSARLVECVDSMAQIVDELVDLARVDVAPERQQRSHFVLAALLHETARAFEPQARGKGLAIEVDCDTATAVHSDRRLVARVLANLVSNAVRYTERGHVRLTGRTDGDTVQVTVQDSGIGIAEDELPRIFEEFYQVGNPARDRRLGVGLGLATVKRLSDALGLALQVQSSPGEGSQFSFSLPAGSIAPPPEAARPADHDPLAARRVLVVEDDADSRAALLGLLHGWGCDARAAGNVAGTRERLAEGFRPDAVLADLRLAGGASGIDAVAAVRAALAPQLPALVMTGDVGSEHARRAADAGLLVLAKPVKPMQLRAFLGQAFAAPDAADLPLRSIPARETPS
ncbi:ATP-binding protein [Roseateles asaccharophilus]|uniref:histidine kinase n=1 Tax=Roseateles asaccharophilus TaxID=582607 RepID=A0ABU2A7A1_9BURK|nr:ATP-binding protein [Roseateles asaccharophilus]MDR7333071.1 signal transduction histidine kinase [Roseateles asaccharophilus]